MWVEDSGSNGTAAASFKIQRIFRYIFGVAHDDIGTSLDYDKSIYSKPVEFLDCDLTFKYQLVSNLFNQSEVNIISYFKNILPSPLYEIFHTFDESNRPKIVIREIPFTPDEWKSLETYNIDPSLITDYTLSQSDQDVYTTFYAYVAGAPNDTQAFKNANATDKKGNVILQRNDELISIYGFVPLELNFIGYKPEDIKDSESVTNVSKSLSEKLKTYFSNLKDFWNGDITFVNILENETVDYLSVSLDKGKRVEEKVSKKRGKHPRVGNKIELCGLEFYVTSATHTWRYGEPCKINLHLERGGKYDMNGNFIEPVSFDSVNKVVNFNPSSLSRTWAELLTKE